MALRDKDAGFVVYRRKSGFFTIVPRGLKGWAQLGAWIALLVPPIIWFFRFVRTNPDDRLFYDGLMLLGTVAVVWLVGGIWYMLACSETVDVAELTRKKFMENRKQRRSRLKQELGPQP